eukprot:PITA_03886
MVEGKPLIIVLHVDDLILTGDAQLIKSCKEDLAREFEMKYMGLMYYFLGMEVWQKEEEVFVSQGKFLLCGEPSQAMVQPTKLFWKAAKHVLRYLRGTSQYGLLYRWTEGVKLQGFTDAYWVGSPSDWNNTSGRIFNLGSATVSLVQQETEVSCT